MHIAAANPRRRRRRLDPARSSASARSSPSRPRSPASPPSRRQDGGGPPRKFYQQVVLLLKQAFVGDRRRPSARRSGAEESAGAPVKMAGFVRFALGEGIEKKEDDFAAEVAAASRRGLSRRAATPRRPARAVGCPRRTTAWSQAASGWLSPAAAQAVRRGPDGHGAYGIEWPSRAARSRHGGRAGAQICVVVGGGNIFRGLAGAAHRHGARHRRLHGHAGDRYECPGPAERLERQGRPARVLSAIPMPTVCETSSGPRRLHHLQRAASSSSPPAPATRFSPPIPRRRCAPSRWTARCAKATQVDGVYSADPPKEPRSAMRYDRLTYTDVLRRLKVMDGAESPLLATTDSGNCLFHQ